MYKDFEKMLNRKGKTIYALARDVADTPEEASCIRQSLYDWKHGKSRPKYQRMLKIAFYLDTDVTTLMGGE